MKKFSFKKITKYLQLGLVVITGLLILKILIINAVDIIIILLLLLALIYILYKA